jgi:hypothetical protein
MANSVNANQRFALRTARLRFHPRHGAGSPAARHCDPGSRERHTAYDAIEPHDIVGETFVNVSNTAPALRVVINEYLERSNLRIRPDHEVDNLAMAMSLIASTRGVALLPSYAQNFMPWSVISRPRQKSASWRLGPSELTQLQPAGGLPALNRSVQRDAAAARRNCATYDGDDPDDTAGTRWWSWPLSQGGSTLLPR